MKMLKKLWALLAVVYWSAARVIARVDQGCYHSRIGDALTVLGLYPWAIRHLSRSLAIQESGWAHMQLAWAFHMMKDHAAALEHYRRAYELWPNPILAGSLARSEFDMGNPGKARDLLEKARKEEGQLDEYTVNILQELECALRDVNPRDTESG